MRIALHSPSVHVQQHQNQTISLDQLSFTDSIAPISIPKARYAADKQSKLTAQETTQLRAAIGQLNWIATVSQPQISFKVCQASTRVKEAMLADLIHINKVITKVQREQSYLHFPKLDLSSLHVRIHTDASFNNLSDGGSQEGHLVLLADASNSCCPIAWTSNKS